MARFALRIVATPVALIFLSVAHAQVTSVTGELTLPMPGAGHDYIHMLNETVNPVNGAVDIRISVPVPPGRGVTIPFSFGYDSNAAHHFIPGASGDPLDNASYLGAGGWSYVMPYLTMVQHVNTVEYSTSPPQFSHCYYYTDFLFTNLQGSSDLLGLSTSEQNGAGPCVPGNNGYSNSLSGVGESFESAAADGSSTQYPTAVTVSQLDGTVYHFSNTYPGRVHPSANNIGWASLPDWVEDRNGNKITISDSGGGAFTITDTAGRLLSSSGFKATGNTITVSGLATPYQITWGQATSNTAYGTRLYYSGAGGVCTPAPTAPDGTFSEITQITLPNGTSYQFQYAANAGLVSKIIYPSGGYVRYAWGKNLLSDKMDFLDNVQTNTSPTCHEEYDTQAVTDRYVSYDGVTEVLHQHFTYTTNWNTAGNWPNWTTKVTSVTTYDLVRGTNFQTVYNYTPSQFFGSSEPNDPVTYSGNNIPVESSVVYYSTSGTRLKTIYKGFVSPTLPPDEKVVLDNNQTSQTTHTYLSEYTTPPQPCSVGSCSYGAALAVPSDKYEYDYGAGSPGNLIRHTHTDYGPSGQTPIGGILELPSDTITYDGGGTRAAEADYSYDQTPVTPVSSLTGHDETNFSSSYQNPRGNLTSKTVQCIGCTNAITTYTYDETGQLLTITDPCGNAACSDMTGTNHTTSYAYADNYAAGSGTPPGTTNAFVTTITYPTVNGVTQHKYFQYAYSDGQLTQSQDDNQKTASLFTSYAYNDSLRRLTETDYPDGGQTFLAYSDTAPSPTTTTCSNINGTASATCSAISPPTGWVANFATMDGIGHVVKTQLVSDPEGTDSTDTSYDGTGSVYTTSNPHRSSSSTTDGTATYTYDALGRTTNVSEPDGSSVATLYSGNQTTVTDEAGNQRTSVTDGLSRLIQVLEDPGVSPHLNYETDYTYDALNNLLSVTQKGGTTTSSQWRTRTFTYDSISRLLCAANPEIKIVSCPASAPFPFGAVTYTYDADGNLATKTAPSPNQPSTGTATVTTNYAYDALNRITGKTYADSYANPATLPVIYGYDGKAITGCPADTPPSNTDTYPKGRRTSMCDGAEAATWTHDIMGRIRQESRSIAAVIGQHDNDTYNLDGSVAIATSLGFQYAYTYNGAGRPISALGGNNFVQSGTVTYARFGGLTSAKMGPTGGTPITITNAYNNRLQPLLISAAAGTSTIISLCYDFHMVNVPTPNTACSLAAGSGDNGNIFRIVNNRDNNRSQNFLYDSLNRISQAYSSGTNWGETYGPTATNPGVQPTPSGIDAWGNLTNRSGVTGKSNTEGWNCLATNQNQIGSCSITYDPAGNTIQNGSIAYTYDAENRLIATQGMSYLYDGDGKRVEKCTQGTTPGTCATGATGTLYWTGPGSDPLAETDLAGNVLENYIFFNGQRIARREPGTTPTIHFYFSDHLGSHGMVTDKTGSICEQDIDYYPYGGVEQDYCPTVAQHFKFTGKERDSESGLDYFGARYNASNMGRFMTPDWSPKPEPVPYADFGNPQSFNQYSYSGNNPSSKSDPDGHCDIDGEHHWGWCLWHSLGFYETQADRVNDARNFFNNNNVTIGGIHVDPSKMTDQQVLAAFKQYNDAYGAAGGNVSPNGALAALLPGAGLKYEANPKHGTSARGDVSAEPSNPQQTLENSVPIKNTSTARVGVDPSTGEYVMFRETSSGVYHGYATTNFNDLPNEAKAALQDAGMVSQRGKMQ